MRVRLILSFILVVMISIISVVVSLVFSARREVGAVMFRGGMVDVQELASALETYYRQHNSWEGVDGQLWGETGMGMGRRQGGGMGQGMGMMNQRMRLAEVDGRLVVDTADPNPNGYLTAEEVSISIPLRVRLQTVGYLLLEGSMTFSQNDRVNLLARLNRAAWTAGLVGGGLSLLLAILLTYRLVHPVQNLTRGAQKLAAGNLSQRVEISGDRELASLGVAFNKMAESLEQAEQSRQALTADIAHELRTPLAVQRAYLEALQDGVYPMDSTNLEPVLAQNLLLTRLVEDLRTLALAEAGQLALNLQQVDLSELVKGMVDSFAPKAAGHQVELIYHPYPTQMEPLLVDPNRIEQIISNLLTNALRYTPVHKSIQLRLELTPAEVRLSVQDGGLGISEEALPQIFERFYRADPSRSREEGGTGLGLAIARQLAQAHGGSLTAANHLQGGALFTLILPRQPSYSPA